MTTTGSSPVDTVTYQLAPEPPERAFASTPGALHERTPRSHRRDVKVRRLGRHPVVASCTPLQLRRIAAVADEVDVAAGILLASQGWLGYWFFLIVDGTAEVVRDGEPVGVLGPGTCFGEVAALGGVFSEESVRSLTEMTVVVIHNQRFVPLVDDIPTLRRTFSSARDRGHALRAARDAEMLDHSRRIPAPERQHVRTHLLAPERARSIPIVLPRPKLSRAARRRRWATATAIVATLGVFGVRYHPPAALVLPGTAVDIGHDITITGVAHHEPAGRYLLTPVRFSRPNAMRYVIAEFQGRTVVPAESLGVTREERNRERAAAHALFDRSRDDAALAVAKQLHVSFTARFRERDIGGPSAGLIYALAIADMVSTSPPVPAGTTIAATGTIDRSGTVGAVGHVHEKAIVARRGQARLFIVPRGQRPSASRLHVHEAITLEQVLRQLPRWYHTASRRE